MPDPENDLDIIYEEGLRDDVLSWYDDFVRRVLARLDIRGWQMSVTFCDDQAMREYNSRWRSLDRPTDVISFALDDSEEIFPESGDYHPAGDILISVDTVRRNAGRYGVEYEEELKRVTIHGVLHLAGHDHPGDDWDKGMLKLQEDILTELTGREASY